MLNFYSLTKYLGPDQPVYGLQSLGLDGKRAPLTRIEDMAAHYLREIRSLQPEGPYLIGGMSFGGMVAYEIAQQLLAQGEQVGLLALLDVGAWGYTKTLPKTEFYRLLISSWLQGGVKFYVGNIVRLPAREKLVYCVKRERRSKTRSRIDVRSRNTSNFLNNEREMPQALRNVKQCNFLARSLCKPKPYAGRVTVFRAVDKLLTVLVDPRISWKHLALGGVDIHEVPGDHLTLVDEPNAQVLAEKLKRCICKAHQSLFRWFGRRSASDRQRQC